MDNKETVHIPSLDEDGAIRVFNELAVRFGWTGTPFTAMDIEFFDDDWDITPAMVEAVMDSYTWRKGIPERVAELGFRMLSDCLTVRPDGTFVVDGRTFNADGTPKN